MSTELFARNNNFDFLRLIAISQIVILHGIRHLQLAVSPHVEWILRIIPGVPVFFVISGFLISLSLERHKSWSTYFLNRFLRIYPPLWVCLGFSIATVFVFGGFPWTEVGPLNVLAWIFAQATFLQFYNPDFLRQYGVGVVNGSLWMIPVLVQFYLLMPFLHLAKIRIGTKRYATFLILLIVGSALINQWYVIRGMSNDQSVYFKLIGVTFFPWLYMALLGVLLQNIFCFFNRQIKNRVTVWLSMYVGIVILFQFLGIRGTDNAPNPIAMTVLAILVISFAYSIPGLSKKMLREYDLSYGIYIYHMVIFNVLVERGGTGSFFYLWLGIAVTVFVAHLSRAYVENPLRHLKKSISLTVPHIIV